MKFLSEGLSVYLYTGGDKILFLACVSDGVLCEMYRGVIIMQNFIRFLQSIHGCHFVARKAVVSTVRIVDKTISSID